MQNVYNVSKNILTRKKNSGFLFFNPMKKPWKGQFPGLNSEPITGRYLNLFFDPIVSLDGRYVSGKILSDL